MKKKNISIEKLLLNTENPRFEPVKNQQQAIDLMVSKGSKTLLNLAKDIAQHGLNPSKSLMVVETDNEHYIPQEGNRRVVALKLLYNPDATTDKRVADKFNEIKKEFGSQIPNEVECTIFSDKESAFRWVNLEHTGRNKGVGILSWDSTQRQRFISQYAGKRPSRPIQLFDFADENGIKRDGVDATTLQRLVATPFVRAQIGIDFPDGLLDLTKTKSKVLKNLRQVFHEMSKKDFKVGDVYTKDKSKEWIIKVLGITAKTKILEQKPAKPQPIQDVLDGDWISAALYHAYPKQNRVKEIIKELKDLKPYYKPNICATSLRVLLELAVYVFLKDRGQIFAIINDEKQRFIEKNKKSKIKTAWKKDWLPSFQRMLDHITNDEHLWSDPQERKALKTFISKKSSEPFLVELNQFIHNPDYAPTPELVIEIWRKLGKLAFRNILSGQK